MPMNLGYLEGTCEDGDVVVRVYYDPAYEPVGDTQPLVDGPRGWCLDVTNKSGRNTHATLTTRTGETLRFNITRGDPVTTGQARSRTAAQMAQAGYTTRGDVILELAC